MVSQLQSGFSLQVLKRYAVRAIAVILGLLALPFVLGFLLLVAIIAAIAAVIGTTILSRRLKSMQETMQTRYGEHMRGTPNSGPAGQQSAPKGDKFQNGPIIDGEKVD